MNPDVIRGVIMKNQEKILNEIISKHSNSHFKTKGKKYSSLETGIQVSALKGSIIGELIRAGVEYSVASQIAENTAIKIYGRPQ